MKLLLDTHAFIWWYNEPDRLPQQVLSACQDTHNTLMLSVASVWEMQIKSQLDKLRLSAPLTEIIAHQQEQNHLQILPITLPAVFALAELPLHHRDPFDRLIIAQAKIDQLQLVSNDSQFRHYSVSVFWS